MPGSTAPSDLKAKAASPPPPASNGIFVRPVAVAGIFRPAAEAKPPALPEKRRFSALVGDLRPCAPAEGPPDDEFARRRQSWDCRQKETPPFGQSLLRKTPARNDRDPPQPKQESTRKSPPKLDPVPPEDAKNSLTKCPNAEAASKNNGVTTKVPTNANSTVINNFDQKPTKWDIQSKTTTTSCETDSKTKSQTATSKVGAPEKDSQKSLDLDSKTVTTTTSKPSKPKVYGLGRRDSKTDKPVQPAPKPPEHFDGKTTNNVATGDHSDLITKVCGLDRRDSKTDKFVPSSSKPPEHIDKSTNHAAADDQIYSKPKSYGLGRRNSKTDKPVQPAPKPSDHFDGKTTNHVAAIDQADSKTKVYGLDRRDSKTDKVAPSSSKPPENIDDKTTNHAETDDQIYSKPKSYGLGRRDSKTDKTAQSAPKPPEHIDSKTSNKVSAADHPDSKAKLCGIDRRESKTDKAVLSSKPPEHVHGKTTNHVAAGEHSDSKTPAADKKTAKTGDASEENKKSALDTPPHNLAKPAESATQNLNDTTAQKENFKKADSPPPKDFRTVRRTSDVIAAKIQNIFSNFAAEKPPAIVRRSKLLEKDKFDPASIKPTPECKEVERSKSEPEPSKTKEEHVKEPVCNEKLKTSPDNRKENLGKPAKVPAVNPEPVCNEKPKENLGKPVNVPAANPEPVCNEKLKTSPEKPKDNVVKPAKVPTDNPEPVCNEKLKITPEKLKENLVKPAKVPAVNPEPVCNDKLKISPETPKESSVNLSAKVNDCIKKPEIPIENSTKPTSDIKVSVEETSKQMNVTVKLETKTTGEPYLKTSALNFAKKKFEQKTAVEKKITCKTNAETTTAQILKTTHDRVVQESDKTKENASAYKLDKKLNVDDKKSDAHSLSQTAKSDGNQQVALPVSKENVSSVENIQNGYHKSDLSFKNNELAGVSFKSTTCESARVEITKLSPTAEEGIVPTINVHYRTKSPLTSAKEENRKKVIVEPTGVEDKDMQSFRDALKAVEEVQKSLKMSPKIPPKQYSNGEDAQKSLNAFPKSSFKQNGSISDVEVQQSLITSPRIPPKQYGSSNGEDVQKSLDIPPKIPLKQYGIINGTDVQKPLNTSPKIPPKFNGEDVQKSPPKNGSSNGDPKHCEIQVVDLGDWNRRFQRAESELPRVPLRRRASSREPLRSSVGRFSSLRKVDDPGPLRSPSQSSFFCSSTLPQQRYSYTEMLSKVCSLGVIPGRSSLDLSSTTGAFPKSWSSSSSQVSELWSELSEEQSTATHASEMLEAETTERMRLEKEVQELQSRYSHVQQKSDKMELEMMEARVYRSSEINGDLSEDEDAEGNSSIYKQKYERAVRDMEIMKRRVQQQQEEEIEQKMMLKKASDKRLAEALEDVEEERQVANQWKRKAQKLGSELQDLRLMLEEQMARNGELEKKQRRFDAELNSVQEEIKKERILREKLVREKDQAVHEKYALEQDLQAAKVDMDMLNDKIAQLNRELDELTVSSKGEEEVTQLKRAKQELERKNRDQEEELEELAAQVQMLEQAKLRLEMSLEKLRQEHRREASVREEEIEEIRASFSKKVKNLEAQLEAEQDERHQLLKQKHELERRVYELTDLPPPQDPEIERRLRRDLKRTKALLRDAQAMLEHTRDGQASKTVIRQLKNQLEDAEFAKSAAVKARQAADAELQELQLQLEEATRVKNDAESRCLQLSREKSAIQTQLEEAEEEMAEVMKKYKAVVAQMSIDQKSMTEQNQQIAELEAEKQMLKDQLSEVSHRFEHLAGQSEDTHKVHRLDGKVRDLESKLELEQTTRSRLEHQIARLKELNDRAREESDTLRNKEIQAQEGVRRLQRQIRDMREDYASLQQKEADTYRKQHELEMALANADTDLQVTKNDLRLACQRIQDLQNALEDDLDSGTDVPDDSGSDSDSSFDMSVLRNQCLTPVQRCASAASDLCFGMEGARSRTSSFSQELSAFGSRNDAEKDFNGFSGLSDTQHQENETSA